MPKAPEPSSTCQKTTKSLPRISPKSYCYNAVPNRFLAHFSTSRTTGPRSLSRVKAGTHSPLLKGSHTTARTPKQGLFRMGPLSLPSTRTARSRTSPGRVSERRTLPLWDLGREVLSKNAESLRDSDALMRVAVPRRRGPAGLRDLFSLLSKLWLVRPAFRAFRVYGAGVVSLPSACSACCRSSRHPLVKAANLPFSEVG